MAHWIATGFGQKTMSGRGAKDAFGLSIDTARAEPVLIEKHGRGVFMVIAVEKYGRLRGEANAEPTQSDRADSKRIGNRRGTERARANGDLNWITNFISGIADDTLRDL